MTKYKTIFIETLKGKSLNRTVQNLALSDVTISGEVVDLGSKTKKSSYYRFLKLKPNTNILFTDLFSQDDGILKIDLEKQFPLKNDSKDFLLLNNVLEHLFNYQTCIQECHRILKKDGYLIGVVPFTHPFHPDPDDYFRYTSSSLKRLFKEAGFTEIQIKPLGFGPISTGVAQFSHITGIKILGALICITSILIDNFLNKIFKKTSATRKANFALSYLFLCKK